MRCHIPANASAQPEISRITQFPRFLKEHELADRDIIYIASSASHKTVLASPWIRFERRTELNDNVPRSAPDASQRVLASAAELCDGVSRVNDEFVGLLGCGHLSARPTKLDQARGWAALAEVRHVAAERARALADRRHQRAARSCACYVSPIVRDLAEVWDGLAVTLTVLGPEDKGKYDRYSTIREGLIEQLTEIEARIAALTSRTHTARAFADVGTGMVTGIFADAVAAGCVHIPVTTTAERSATTLAAIGQLYDTAWHAHDAISSVVSPARGNLEIEDHTPPQCGGMLPAPLCAALETLADLWVRVLGSAHRYAILGKPQDLITMLDTATALGTHAKEVTEH